MPTPMTLNVTLRAEHQQFGYVEPHDEYVEHFWLPLVGPSAWALLRLLHDQAHGRVPRETLRLDVESLARLLGTAGHTVFRAMGRLARWKLVEGDKNGGWILPSRIPRLGPKELRRLSEALELEHERWQ